MLHCVKVLINDRNFLLVNAYIPPPYKDEVLKSLFGKMVQWPYLPTLVMADLNNILNEEEDRHSTTKGKQRMKRTIFARQLQEMGLIDM